MIPAARKLFDSVARIYGKYIGEANGRALVPDHGKSIISAYQPLP